MRRREVSDTKLSEVIKLKKSGASWLRIQRDTGIPRRSAKRAYEDWERSKSSEELKTARTNVVAEEFRKHLDTLSSLAESLISSLRLPQTTDGVQDADEVLGQVWRRDILAEGKNSTVPQSARYDEDRIIRKNARLFSSLQEHTREKVRWQTLDEWKQARNSYCSHLGDVHSEARKILGNILSQKLDLKGRGKKSRVKEDIIDAMTKGVVEAVVRSILTGKPEEVHVWKGTSVLSEGTVEVRFGDNISHMSLNCPDVDLAKEVMKACKWAIDNLRKGERSDLVQAVACDIREMQTRAKELEGMLDDLVLRPIILRTRCELCPA